MKISIAALAIQFLYLFSYSQPLKLDAPNGGEIWYTGSTQKILWTDSSFNPSSTTIRISYTFDNGVSWFLIDSNATNNGTYQLTVPTTPSAKCLVAVYANNGQYSDTSDANFQIKGLTNIFEQNEKNRSFDLKLNYQDHTMLVRSKSFIQNILIYDITGSKIKESIVNDVYEQVIDVSSLPVGCYIVTLQGDQGSYSKKILIAQ